MKTYKAEVNGREVTIYVPETPEERLEMERRVKAGEIGYAGGTHAGGEKKGA